MTARTRRRRRRRLERRRPDELLQDPRLRKRAVFDESRPGVLLLFTRAREGPDERAHRAALEARLERGARRRGYRQDDAVAKAHPGPEKPRGLRLPHVARPLFRGPLDVPAFA